MSPAVGAFVVQPLAVEQIDDVVTLLVAGGWSGAALPSRTLLFEADLYGAAFVATDGEDIVGFVRIISDSLVVSYVAELIVAAGWRDKGVGRSLLDACHGRFPTTRIDLLSSELAMGFYERTGFGPKPGYRRWPT